MPSSSQQAGNKIALVSTPWPLYSRPSIQLGTLKAYLQSSYPALQIDAHHVYLKLADSIGYRRYHEISQRTWLAETIYAALLFPERFEVIERLFIREVGSKSNLKDTGLKRLTAMTKKATQAFIRSCDWGNYLLAGFSVSLCQLTSALYFIKRIKQKFPELIIVIGGSTLSGSTTRSFFEIFSEVDAVINGEGELPFSQLIGCLRKSPRLTDVAPINGIIVPKAAQSYHHKANFNQMKELSSLPAPDYDDYFNLLKSFKSHNRFFPTLPVETSRGCWWQRTLASSKAHPKTANRSTGCAFCNLNLQWTGYRAKDPPQVVNEIDQLTAKYRTLSVAIADNVLPRKTSKKIFEKLETLKKDLRLFSEIRATTSYQELKAMGQSGLQEVQIGIEALSGSLLKKLHKGTTAIQNLEIMRNCETLGIINISNLILNFPGSDKQDVAETLDGIKFAIPYRPLKAVGFWLGYGSPVWRNPKAYGIR
ncbi:MAG: RiPP maturation radical SAM C-methyltransferase, partial [Deltaproteobacteria bacterium]|nr:RiPP maturation radical SAM C-methyltransferase [Deltaproteobacteria bacterium]